MQIPRKVYNAMTDEETGKWIDLNLQDHVTDEGFIYQKKVIGQSWKNHVTDRQTKIESLKTIY